ncbi:phospholipase D family protein [Anaerovorax sp. IOR16]|uniref:phospholipase D family protein n=1 Tax=Anaerovorax sp. IOR16 TaxID=2773458 RepID=UPI0019D29AFB|nr:phospholipase D family protein [Anaerovorax sp. IOR16]
MYYWSEDDCNINLEEELTSMNNVSELYIGIAFFSSEGLRILKNIAKKNKLKKENVHIYMSDEFSQNKPHELLEEVCKIAKVKIFFHRMFHAKVYLLKGDTTKLIYGSSNFTAGGFYKNIEFDSIQEIGKKNLNEIEDFFKYCELHSTTVTDDVIQHYKEMYNEIKELKKIQEKLRKKIKGYHKNKVQMSDIHNDVYPIIERKGLLSSIIQFMGYRHKKK